MAEYLKWSENTVRLLNKEIRKALPTSGFEGGFDPTTISPNRDSEKLKLIKYELTPEEQLVYEYTIGDAQPILKPGQIASKRRRYENLNTLMTEVKTWAEDQIKRLDNEAKFMRAVVKGRTGSEELGSLNLFEASKVIQAEIDEFIVFVK